MTNMKLNEIDNLFTCSVCLSAYDDEAKQPRFLNCFHTFCTGCLKILLDPTLCTIQCPSCRQNTDCQTEGVHSLVVNLHALQLTRISTIHSQCPHWCLTCNCTVGGSCESHLTVSLGTSTLQQAKKLQLGIDVCQKKWDKAFRQRQRLTGHLNRLNSALKKVHDEVSALTAESETILAALENKQHHPLKTIRSNETVCSLTERLLDLGGRLNREAFVSNKLLDECALRSDTRIKIILEDSITGELITTVDCFENGFTVDDLPDDLFLVSYFIFSTLKSRKVRLDRCVAEKEANQTPPPSLSTAVHESAVSLPSSSVVPASPIYVGHESTDLTLPVSPISAYRFDDKAAIQRRPRQLVLQTQRSTTTLSPLPAAEAAEESADEEGAVSSDASIVDGDAPPAVVIANAAVAQAAPAETTILPAATNATEAASPSLSSVDPACLADEWDEPMEVTSPEPSVPFPWATDNTKTAIELEPDGQKPGRTRTSPRRALRPMQLSNTPTAQSIQDKHAPEMTTKPAPAVASKTIPTAKKCNKPATHTVQLAPETAKIKCLQFLCMLLEAASKRSDAVATNVQSLIQRLVDTKIQSDEFVERIQKELSSAPQPLLVPFIKNSLPHLRLSLAMGELVMEDIRIPPLATFDAAEQTAILQKQALRIMYH